MFKVTSLPTGKEKNPRCRQQQKKNQCVIKMHVIFRGVYNVRRKANWRTKKMKTNTNKKCYRKEKEREIKVY